MTFDTVLVANRGEIAVRVIRTLREMGIRSVAVFSDADADARHVAEADVAVAIGPASARQSYLDIDAVVDAARRTGAQAVHPGYGFLSENAEFAAALEAASIVFIGPPVKAIQTMGDKIVAKTTVSSFGVPVVPGIARPGLTDDELVAGAADIGYPVLVKPSAGGGGKGMRVVHQPSELHPALTSARREAAAAFGDDTLFLERFVLNPRHIEVQVLADGYGNVVHLGERECSLQRRHQKVIEEAPSPLLDAATRARIGAAACDTARSVDYTGAGTVEFIVSADRPDEFFFMEMNTRLQVEHPVTEMVTGIDLVELQVRVAAGEKLPITQDDIAMTGHAIEARVYAEDPARGFLPTGGTVLGLVEPHGPGVRVDSGLARRHRGRQRLRPDAGQGHRARRRPAGGAARARPCAGRHRGVGRDHQRRVPAVPAGRSRRRRGPTRHRAAGPPNHGFRCRCRPGRRRADRRRCLQVVAELAVDPAGSLWEVPSGWRMGQHASTAIRLRAGERTDHVYLTGTPQSATAAVEDGERRTLQRLWTATELVGDPRRTTHRIPRRRRRAARSGWRERDAPRSSRRCGKRRCVPTTSTAATPNSSAPCRDRWSPSASRTGRR